MLSQQRYTRILELLARQGAVRSADLIVQLGVSGETIRRDLDRLSGEGRLKRVHGGAIVAPNGSSSTANFRYESYRERETQNLSQKRSMAQAAAQIVEEGQCVALDAGTSSLLLARELTERFEKLTVVTNSVKNAMILADKPGYTVILTGGVLHADESSLTSELTMGVLSALNLDIFFLTASGVTPDGLTDQRMDEILVQERMLEIANRTIAIIDSSKFGRTAPFKLCALSDIDLLITDDRLSSDLETAISTAGGRLLIVPTI